MYEMLVRLAKRRRGGMSMTVYELIQALAYYPADTQVSVKISNNTKMDISDINTEYRNTTLHKTESIVIEVE